MKLDQLRTFAAVVRAGGLAQAGDKIGRTPAAVSMTLKQIEADLGGLLFEGERKKRLTPLGHVVYAQAQQALQAFDASMAHIRSYAQGGAGVTRIAAVPSAATRLLPEAIARMRAHAPKVRIELRDIDSVAVILAVRTGAVDIGIATLSADHADRLHAQPLLQDPFVLVCPAKHPLRALKRPIRWADIDPAQCIANGLCARLLARQAAHLLQDAPLTLHNTTSLLTFVTQGFGVTLLPTLAVRAHPAIRLLPLADRSAVRQLDLLTRRDASLSPVSEAMRDWILTCCQRANRAG